MRSLIRYSITLFLFWLVVFLPFRVFFILYQWPLGNRIHNSGDIAMSFVKGYPLEVATGFVLCGLPVFFAWLFSLLGWKNRLSILRYIVLFLLILYSAVALADAGLYREWQAKINLQALAHFKNPKEIFKTVSVPQQGIFILLVSLFTWFFFRLYKKWIHSSLSSIQPPPFPRRVLWFFFLPVYGAITVIGIRGGIWNLPISQSAAYFSKDMLANDMAVNPLYNLMQDMTLQGKIPDRTFYVHYSDEEVKASLRSYYQVQKDTTTSILKIARPNIVFIILESWSSDEVGCLGGLANATPFLDSLSKEGITFEKAYASAYISDQGIPAILSGYPGLSKISAINQPRVISQLPSLSEDLHRNNYSTAFLYGGDLVFGNIKGYVSAKSYDEIIDVHQLSSLPQGQLGVHDEDMFPQLLEKCCSSREPFMHVLFTLSTHMPYDFKSKENWKAPPHDVEARYSESIHYSDREIGRFFQEAKKQPWYDHTLFVLVADHSHNTWKQNDLALPERHHIPLFFLGGALRDEVRGKKIDRVVAQMDIPFSLCRQLQLNPKSYTWSRDLLNEYTPSGAYFPFYGGAGFIDQQGFCSGRQANGSWVSSFSDSLQKEKYGCCAYSFMQKIYQEIYDR